MEHGQIYRRVKTFSVLLVNLLQDLPDTSVIKTVSEDRVDVPSLHPPTPRLVLLSLTEKTRIASPIPVLLHQETDLGSRSVVLVEVADLVVHVDRPRHVLIDVESDITNPVLVVLGDLAFISI